MFDSLTTAAGLVCSDKKAIQMMNINSVTKTTANHTSVGKDIAQLLASHGPLSVHPGYCLLGVTIAASDIKFCGPVSREIQIR